MSAASWDAEHVLAFVHDTKPYAEMDEAERVEWCRKVKHVRDTSEGVWTNKRLAGLFELSESGLKGRFDAISAAQRGKSPTQSSNQPTPNQKASVRSAKAAIRQHPTIVDDDFVKLVAANPKVQQQVVQTQKKQKQQAVNRTIARHARPTTRPVKAPDVFDLMAIQLHYKKAKEELLAILDVASSVPDDLKEPVSKDNAGIRDITEAIDSLLEGLNENDLEGLAS